MYKFPIMTRGGTEKSSQEFCSLEISHSPRSTRKSYRGGEEILTKFQPLKKSVSQA